MLATILRTKVATETSIRIMRAFVTMRKYIILDNKIFYHCGTSLNNAGNKTFSINRLEDEEIITALLNKILKNL